MSTSNSMGQKHSSFDIHTLSLEMFSPSLQALQAWWRSSLIGYILAFPLVGLCTLLIALSHYVSHQILYFPGIPFLMVMVFIAYFWRLGPAFLTIALSIIAINYIDLPFFHQIGFRWQNLPNLWPAVLVEVIIAWFVAQLGARQHDLMLAKITLAERATQLETIVETITDGFILFDQEGQWIYLNAIACGWLASHLPSLHYALSPPEWQASIPFFSPGGDLLSDEQSPIRRILRGEILQGSQAADILVRPPNEQERFLSVSGAPLRRNGGPIMGGIALLRDVTHHLRREQQLQKAKEELELFLAMASHELRTPLTCSLTNLHLAKRQFSRLEQSDASRERLTHILDKISHTLTAAESPLWKLDRLISNLLEVSRIQTGKLLLEKRFCDLRKIVSEAIEEQRLLHPRVTLHLDILSEEPIPVLVDPDRIGQVISNYVTNALKYAGEDQPVEIYMKCEKQMAYVAIRDRGPGLSPQECVRIWERFACLSDKCPKQSNPGLGLGLYICKSIIEQHHGQVGVESREKEGATFWFTLPCDYSEQPSHK